MNQTRWYFEVCCYRFSWAWQAQETFLSGWALKGEASSLEVVV